MHDVHEGYIPLPRNKRRLPHLRADQVDKMPMCWEVCDCPDERREKCPAYPSSGTECWKITGTLCNGGALRTASFKEKILYCRNECEYYRKHIKQIYP